jgi:hypothetical protein
MAPELFGKVFSMRTALRILFMFCLFAGAARADQPEDAYLAARDKYISKIKAMEKAKASDEKVWAEHEKGRADLETRLRALLGDVSVKGFPATGKINLESLTDSGVGFGMLDGLVYSGDDENAPRLVVTTRNLLDKWLAARSREKGADFRLPADLGAALQLDPFYTFSIGSDAAFTRNANLEVTAPAGAELVRATLGGWAQDIGPNPNYTLIVTLTKGGKVYIGSLRPKTAIGEIAACEAIWTQAQQKVEKLQAAYRASKRKDDETFDADTKAEEKGDKDFHACFIERAPKEPFYPALVKEAQEFADRIAGK